MAVRSNRKRAPSSALSRRPLVLLALWGVGTLVIAGILVAADRAWVGRNVLDPSGVQGALGGRDALDPAARVAGAIRSISGSDSVRRVSYDTGTQSVRLEVSSRYFDSAKPMADNRQYLATEGRLGAQLALFENTSIQKVTILLYSRGQLLATVSARQGDAFEAMQVEYHGALAGS